MRTPPITQRKYAKHILVEIIFLISLTFFIPVNAEQQPSASKESSFDRLTISSGIRSDTYRIHKQNDRLGSSSYCGGIRPALFTYFSLEGNEISDYGKEISFPDNIDYSYRANGVISYNVRQKKNARCDGRNQNSSSMALSPGIIQGRFDLCRGDSVCSVVIGRDAGFPELKLFDDREGLSTGIFAIFSDSKNLKLRLHGVSIPVLGGRFLPSANASSPFYASGERNWATGINGLENSSKQEAYGFDSVYSIQNIHFYVHYMNLSVLDPSSLFGDDGRRLNSVEYYSIGLAYTADTSIGHISSGTTLTRSLGKYRVFYKTPYGGRASLDGWLWAGNINVASKKYSATFRFSIPETDYRLRGEMDTGREKSGYIDPGGASAIDAPLLRGTIDARYSPELCRESNCNHIFYRQTGMEGFRSHAAYISFSGSFTVDYYSGRGGISLFRPLSSRTEQKGNPFQRLKGSSEYPPMIEAFATLAGKKNAFSWNIQYSLLFRKNFETGKYKKTGRLWSFKVTYNFYSDPIGYREQTTNNRERIL